jgi:tetraacyldisaccharide 4'-kinase
MSYFLMGLESVVLDIMDGKRPGRSLLTVLSYLYKSGVRLRNHSYDANWIERTKVPAIVISVGNIVAGGTGKTPFVKHLAEALMPYHKLAILSRGYKSQFESSGQVHKLTGHERAEDCGDEPLWLAQQLPSVQVWVGKNRTESAAKAVADGAEIIILDDGMQYRKLHRDFEIVMLGGDEPLGKGRFLPRGFLRDRPERLKIADLIIVNHAKSPADVRAELHPLTEAPLIFAKMKLNQSLTGRRVAIFCALGHPERFMQAVREAGAEVVATFFKPDHDTFLEDELIDFSRRSKADLLVCTEKDFVKLPSLTLPIQSLKSEWQFDSGFDIWEKFLETVKHKVQHGIPSHTS